LFFYCFRATPGLSLNLGGQQQQQQQPFTFGTGTSTAPATNTFGGFNLGSYLKKALYKKRKFKLMFLFSFFL
jgi:hypothetical protein